MGQRRRNRRRATRGGHFCGCCGRVRPNERFSGRGHRDHVCRACSSLPVDERRYRQAVRNMDRLAAWDGRVSRRNRPRLSAFLGHPLPRVRDHARRLLAAHEASVARQRELDAWNRLDEYLFEAIWEIQAEAEEALLGAADDPAERLCDSSVLAESPPFAWGLG